MTIERIIPNTDLIKQAFSSTERPYVYSLVSRTNHLLDLILFEQATKEERLEYHALKWALKEIGGIEKESFEKVNR